MFEAPLARFLCCSGERLASRAAMAVFASKASTISCTEAEEDLRDLAPCSSCPAFAFVATGGGELMSSSTASSSSIRFGVCLDELGALKPVVEGSDG